MLNHDAFWMSECTVCSQSGLSLTKAAIERHHDAYDAFVHGQTLEERILVFVPKTTDREDDLG